MRVIQILNNPKNRGGIQKVANNLKKVLDLEGVCNIKTDIDFETFFKLFWLEYDNAVIVHGMSNLVTLRVLLLAIADKLFFKRIKLLVWQPHFHPFKYHKRPIMARIYFYSVNIPLGWLSNKIVVITPTEHKFLSRWFDDKKISIIPNPLEIKHFNSEDGEWGGVGEKYILAVGRNEYSKKLELVAKYSSCIKKNLGCKTVIVSSGFETVHEDCICLSNCSDYILSRLYEEAECVVIPSLYEAFSLVAVEAMMRGKKVVCRENMGAAAFKAVRPQCVFSDFSQQSYVNSVSQILNNNNNAELPNNYEALREEFDVGVYFSRWSTVLLLKGCSYEG